MTITDAELRRQRLVEELENATELLRLSEAHSTVYAQDKFRARVADLQAQLAALPAEAKGGES
jgi:hypothetical protein